MPKSSPAILGFFLHRILPPLAVAIGVLLTWHFFVVLVEPKPYVFCSPMEVWGALAEEPSVFFWATFYTTRNMVIAFIIAGVVGIVLALLLTSHIIVERALYPYTVFFQTVPLVAVAIMLVLWLENKHVMVIICAFIAAIFPMITNVMQGIKSIPKSEYELFQLYHAKLTDRIFKLILPGAMPSIIAGMRIMSGLAAIGTITGEFVLGSTGDDKGLGMMIALSNTDVGKLFGAVIIASLLGLFLLWVINGLGVLLLSHWEGASR